MKTLRGKIWFCNLIAFLFITSPSLAQPEIYHQEEFKLSIPFGKEHDNSSILVKRVVDGDTLLLENGERVRLIGVDTPETVHPKKPVQHFGKEASKFTKEMVEGKRVRLEYDETSRDKYGRLLVYVFLEDGIFLNAEIIKQGYGFAYTKFPFKYLDEFRQHEREARESKRGLWQD